MHLHILLWIFALLSTDRSGVGALEIAWTCGEMTQHSRENGEISVSPALRIAWRDRQQVCGRNANLPGHLLSMHPVPWTLLFTPLAEGRLQQYDTI
jgi:hypothetical protein